MASAAPKKFRCVIHGSFRKHFNEIKQAQEYMWLPADIALRDLNIEPNARQTVELYANL